MALTDLAIRHARPLGKAYRLSDCHGLYIQVNPSGSKLWYLKFRFGNKENRMALGLIRLFLSHWQGRSKRI
ncbi:integrase [Klebsiella pneumoniae]|uniref:Integrase n=1 Tax=Klebsiella pneumoniae TaxID=573 RepID=A0A2X3EQE6_KLEPN|nr:integrase [Klebsiella pneumoniae]